MAPLATVRSWNSCGIEPARTGLAPTICVPRALNRAGLSESDVDLVEINEAFATMAVACSRKLGFPHDIVNVNGGAVGLGHPVGASGARILVTLIHELRRRGGGIGVGTLCAGGGMGSATVLEVHAASLISSGAARPGARWGRRGRRWGRGPWLRPPRPGPACCPRRGRSRRRAPRPPRTRAKAASNSSGESAKARWSPPSVPQGASCRVVSGLTRMTENGPVLALVAEAHDLGVEAHAGVPVVDRQDEMVQRHHDGDEAIPSRPRRQPCGP